MWFLDSRSGVLPEATGKFVPGITDVMLGYGPGSVLVRLYYPTNEKKNNPENSSRYIPWTPKGNGYILGLAKVLLVFPFIVRLIGWFIRGKIPAVYGTSPNTSKKLKCVVFSHGLGAHRSLYNVLLCELASRGYLVAALEHKGGSACYTYYYNTPEDAKNDKKNHVAYEPFELGDKHFPQRKRQVQVRAKECCKVLDFLIDLNKGKVPENVLNNVPGLSNFEFDLKDLVGNLDLENLTMAGHSFGGGTALLVMAQRKEFKQGIILDPWMYSIKEDSIDEKVQQPLIFINTQTFHINSNVQAMDKYLNNSERTMYTVLHTTHEHQTDTVLLFGSWLNWFMKKLDPLVALKINYSLILDFLYQQFESPTDISDCKKILEQEKDNFEAGLTRPWA